LTTKREKIKQTAKFNPFQSVAEIAEECDTSRAYVREALSNFGLSLRELRKEEYKRLKKEYQMLEEDYKQLAEYLNTTQAS